jgi:hypothetical protein
VGGGGVWLVNGRGVVVGVLTAEVVASGATQAINNALTAECRAISVCW